MIFNTIIKGGSSQSSLPTQTKTVTPGYLEQLVTKDSGYSDLRVIVEGDEDLLSKNIKKDVSIFGVTGSYVGGVEDRLQDVEAFPEPPKPLPNEALLVSADGVQDIVPLFKESVGMTITEILIVNDHTEVSNPVDVSATMAGPVYCDGTDAWMYGDGVWEGLCSAFGFTYKGIVGTRPNNASAYGVYIVKGQTIPSTGTVNKDYVYKITTTKNSITFWLVMPEIDEENPAQVININEMAEAQGGKVEGEYRWGHPNDIKNPISSVESETELYLYFYVWTDGTTTGVWIYMDGEGWIDYMGRMGLPYHSTNLNGVPPTVDMAPGMYTTDETVVDKIKFGIPISEAELYQYIDKLSGSVYSEGKDLLEAFASIGATVAEYKTVETEADIDLSEAQYIYIITSTNQYAFVVNGTSLYKSDVDGVVYDPADVPSTGTYICYNVQNEWESIDETINELKTQLKIQANEGKGEKNFFDYATLTGTADGIVLSAVTDKYITCITIHKDVTSIGESVFYDFQKLDSVIFAEGSQLTSIGKSGFDCCYSLTDITIPNTVMSIGERAFAYGHLTSITFAEGSQLASIGNSAFRNCMELPNIALPNTVTSIGEMAFYQCFELTSITFQGTIEQWNAIEKGANWDEDTGNYTIHCTDGDIAKE